MPHIDDVVGRPQVHFENPTDIAAEPSLTKREKLDALSSWQHDVDHEEMATSEGMPPKPNEDQDLIRKKLERAAGAVIEERKSTIESRPEERASKLVDLQAKGSFDRKTLADQMKDRVVSHPIRSVLVAAAVGYFAAAVSRKN